MLSPDAPLAPPQTYAAWSECLDRLLGAGDDARVLEAMQKGSGHFNTGAVENLARRLGEVFDARLSLCHDRFGRQMEQSRNVVTLGGALLEFRRQLTFLHRVALVKAFPVTIQKHLCDRLDQAAKSTMESLEESARLDRSGETRQCVRRHSLLAFRDETAAPSPAPVPSRKRSFL